MPKCTTSSGLLWLQPWPVKGLQVWSWACKQLHLRGRTQAQSGNDHEHDKEHKGRPLQMWQWDCVSGSQATVFQPTWVHLHLHSPSEYLLIPLCSSWPLPTLVPPRFTQLNCPAACTLDYLTQVPKLHVCSCFSERSIQFFCRSTSSATVEVMFVLYPTLICSHFTFCRLAPLGWSLPSTQAATVLFVIPL